MLRCLSWPLLTQILLLLAAGLAACSPLLPQGATCLQQFQPVCNTVCNQHVKPRDFASQFCLTSNKCSRVLLPLAAQHVSNCCSQHARVMHVIVPFLVALGDCMAIAKHMRCECNQVKRHWSNKQDVLDAISQVIPAFLFAHSPQKRSYALTIGCRTTNSAELSPVARQKEEEEVRPTATADWVRRRRMVRCHL